MSWLGLWGKIKAGAALISVALIAIGVAFWKGRREGMAVIEAEQRRQKDALQQEYDEIDRGAVDPDSAYKRLRDRGGR